jgi:hypothetical protein
LPKFVGADERRLGANSVSARDDLLKKGMLVLMAHRPPIILESTRLDAEAQRLNCDNVDEDEELPGQEKINVSACHQAQAAASGDVRELLREGKSRRGVHGRFDRVLGDPARKQSIEVDTFLDRPIEEIEWTHRARINQP